MRTMVSGAGRFGHRHAHRLGRFFDAGPASLCCVSRSAMDCTLPIFSVMWTGMRMVRLAWAMARVMAWRIHQVA